MCCSVDTGACCCANRATSGPQRSLDRDVEHEGLLLLLARRGGAACPELRGFTSLPDGSAVLAMEDLRGRPLDSYGAGELDDETLDSVWRQVRVFHRAGLAHRSLRAANIMITDDGPAIVDLSAATAPADARLQAIDRAELLTSLATVHGAEASVAAAARVLEPDELAAASPYLQPLALSAATRKQASKSTLKARARGSRRGDRARTREARAARAREGEDVGDDRHARRRVLLPAAAARQRRRQRSRAALGELGMVGGLRR